MKIYFSPWERWVARILSHTPGFKKRLKRAYQFLNFFIFRPGFTDRGLSSVEDIAPKQIGETFFGYYDKSPVNSSGDYVLFHQVNHSTLEAPSASQPIQVLCMRLSDHRVVAEFETSAYNWQQGARLQWITETSFVFNDFDPAVGNYVSRVVEVGREVKTRTLSSPIYDTYEGRFFLTLNFSRLGAYSPDYGYRNIRLNERNSDKLKEDGVFFGSINAQDSQSPMLLATLDSLIKLKPVATMRGAQHTINHIMISPDGTSFLVIHRWLNGGQRFDRLFNISIDGKRKRILADRSMVSHLSWINSTTVGGFFRNDSGTDGYFTIDVLTGEQKDLISWTSWKLGDGHPSFRPGVMLTDSYPNKARLKVLSLVDFRNHRIITLGEFFESLRYHGESRCDLHPRFSPDGHFVYFDSVHSGRRRLYRMHIGGL
jgi:hypothetical protein